MSQSIFRSLSLKRGPVQPPVPAASSTPAVSAPSPSTVYDPPPELAAALAPRPAKAIWSASMDVALIAILEAPLHPEDTVAVGYARKEAELRHVLESLTILEARTLHARLSTPKSGDALARAFTRLTADRRSRLLNFLADARRREALKR